MRTSIARRTVLLGGLASAAAAKVTPRYRTLGKTGLKVTELGFGSEAVSDVTVFERALDAGVNFFDTARSYQGGNAERALGAALGKRRKDVVLCTRSYADSAAQMQSDFEASLKALRTDYVDIWYLGNKDAPERITDEMLRVQQDAVRAGKVRFRGLSTHRLGVMAPYAVEQKFDVVQIPYNFAIGTARDPFQYGALNPDTALDLFRKAGIGVVAMKVMAGGYRDVPIKEKNADIHSRAGSHVAAIHWALRSDRVQTTSVRMTDADQLEENLAAMTGSFTPEEGRLLAAYTDAVSPLLCRMCGACDGKCSRGMPVSDVVRYVMYADGYGRFEMGSEPFRRRVGNVPCAECIQCSVRCPNGVDVRERMERARMLFA